MPMSYADVIKGLLFQSDQRQRPQAEAAQVERPEMVDSTSPTQSSQGIGAQVDPNIEVSRTPAVAIDGDDSDTCEVPRVFEYYPSEPETSGSDENTLVDEAEYCPSEHETSWSDENTLVNEADKKPKTDESSGDTATECDENDQAEKPMTAKQRRNRKNHQKKKEKRRRLREMKNGNTETPESASSSKIVIANGTTSTQPPKESQKPHSNQMPMQPPRRGAPPSGNHMNGHFQSPEAFNPGWYDPRFNYQQPFNNGLYHQPDMNAYQWPTPDPYRYYGLHNQWEWGYGAQAHPPQQYPQWPVGATGPMSTYHDHTLDPFSYRHPHHDSTRAPFPSQHQPHTQHQPQPLSGNEQQHDDDEDSLYDWIAPPRQSTNEQPEDTTGQPNDTNEVPEDVCRRSDPGHLEDA